ncbi:sensor histidine kinase [Aquimarina brevivitae]|uniref:GHKL domain-containing protein n=1 Tax=Aquimarina brevivitae TaxID=323412 RepID=A0A4Q7P221_9FLAO|nr:histidine kinase [Aquimarina brevivitae]RZS93378.1 GHKL domain-containing protein [Aquimarina brevivitae]
MHDKKLTLQQYIELLFNLVFWAAAAAILVFTTETGVIENIVEDNNGIIIEETLEMSVFQERHFWGLLTILPIFYLITFYVIPNYYATKRYLKCSVAVVLCLLLLVATQLLIVFIQGDEIVLIMIRFFATINLLLLSIAIVYGIIRHQLKMEAQQALLEKEKIAAELQLMQSQINPHFMFNALNNLLAISERNECKETSEGIIKLSDLLRFMIYDTKSDQITIQKEIEFITNFIALQQLKYSIEDPFDITFSHQIETDTLQVAPRLLIPLVENAFKHGLRIAHPSFIIIKLKATTDQIKFTVENSKHPTEKTEFENQYSGIGLENVKKRLALIYPGSHSLSIKDKEAIFSVTLIIKK